MGGYLDGSHFLIRKAAFAILLLLVVAAVSGLIGIRLPGGFVPEEDQGYFYVNAQLPPCRLPRAYGGRHGQARRHPQGHAGRQVLHGRGRLQPAERRVHDVQRFYFVSLEPWDQRNEKGLTADVIIRDLNRRLAGRSRRTGLRVRAAGRPGIGTAGGVTFMLEDRAGKDPAFLAESTAKFLEAARKRPEFSLVFTTLLPSVPQLFAEVDRDKVLKQGSNSPPCTDPPGVPGRHLRELLQSIRSGLAGVRPGRGRLPHQGRDVGQFYVRNARGESVPLSTLVSIKPVSGPEFTTRFNEYRAAQINGLLAPGFTTRQGCRHSKRYSRKPCRATWASTTRGCRSRSRWRPRGCRPVR